MVGVVSRVMRGSVADLHANDPFADRTSAPRSADAIEIWHMRPSAPAIVLGSRQDESVLDLEACRAAGLDVVRRRSGGGAVLVAPSSMLWIDLIVPRGVGSVPDDVRGSMTWVGERWADVLKPLADGELIVHDGGMQCSAWSDLVCFAGIGPGEIRIGERKLLGLSQRRTRHGIRVQCLVHRSNAEPMAVVRRLFSVSTPDDSLLVEPAGLPVGAEETAIVDRFARTIAEEHHVRR